MVGVARFELPLVSQCK